MRVLRDCLAGDTETHEAAIVDPAVSLEEYEALLADRKFTLRYVVDTHVHADHVSGARPLNMGAIYATNRGVEDKPWAMLTTNPEVAEVSLAAVESRPPEAMLIDVREHDEYAHGHVPGAVNIPQAELATRLDEVPRDRPVLVICQRGSRSYRAAQFLAQMRYQNVASVAGGTGDWEEQGKPLAYGDTTVERRSVPESQWTHAGALGGEAAG